VGTAIYLAGIATNRPDEGEITLVLDENVGPVPVDVRFEEGRPTFARFTTAMLPEHRPSPHGSAELAAVLGLDAGDVCPDGLEAEMVSCGLPYHVVPVATLGAIKRAVLDLGRWRTLLADSWAHHVYAVCLDAEGPGVDVRVRMFAPGSGVYEDPATGSAAAALGGYLSRIDGREEARLKWTVEQGIEMGRPSLLYVEADRARGATSAVRVGGRAVSVSRGSMVVPD
jgi:trans-2,3-dihydro-3-hydroxyanthranilate isomerase